MERFSTLSAPVDDRFDLWREQYSPLHDVEADRGARRNFKASARQKRVGCFALGAYATPARRVRRTESRCARDSLSYWSIQFPVTSRLHVGAASRWVEPGMALLGDGARPYDHRWTGGEWLTLAMPKGLDRIVDRHAAAQVGPAAALGGFALLGDMIRSLVGGDASDRADAAALEEALLDVIGACLLERSCGIQGAQAPASAARFRIEALIRDNLGSTRLDVPRLAALSGLSRSTLHRMFAAEGGLARYIRTRRLEAIRRDLADPRHARLAVSTLAERSGMHSPSAFSRAFSAEYGVSPRAYRHAARAAWRTQTPPAERSQLARLGDMLRYVD